MVESYDFLKAVLDTISKHIVVIDDKGNIIFSNKSWGTFGQENECTIAKTWDGVNYLNECDKAADMGDEFGIKAANGIRSVINADKETFYFEYPCHSPEEKRWFMMRVTAFALREKNYHVISHQNITERKLAEEEVLNLSRIDGLTGIANRRYFNEFIDNEWRRCNRLATPITLAMIDLDHFKLLNDTYGHLAGDECLKSVGKVLKGFGKRPNDICARYGGEEFSIVFGNTSLDQAKALVSELLNEIRLLNIPNEASPTLPILTISIGLAEMYPSNEGSVKDLIRQSDKLLYMAKKKGRNRVLTCLDSGE